MLIYGLLAVGGHAATEEVAHLVRGDQEGPTLVPLPLSLSLSIYIYIDR